jgi:thioesterase domain-containing protein
VYGLDDRVVESNAEFLFKSIEEVASQCLVMIQSILADSLQQSSEVTDGSSSILLVDLAGWSYGGVVAMEIAKQIAMKDPRIRVRSVAVFDSPLRPGVEVPGGCDEISPFHEQGQLFFSSNDRSLMDRVKSHFQDCIGLLSHYHQRSRETQPLTCPVLEIRPERSGYVFHAADIEEFTSGTVVRAIVPGTHWTMLSGENAISTATVLKTFWESTTTTSLC